MSQQDLTASAICWSVRLRSGVRLFAFCVRHEDAIGLRAPEKIYSPAGENNADES